MNPYLFFDIYSHSLYRAILSLQNAPFVQFYSIVFVKTLSTVTFSSSISKYFLLFSFLASIHNLVTARVSIIVTLKKWFVKHGQRLPNPKAWVHSWDNFISIISDSWWPILLYIVHILGKPFPSSWPRDHTQVSCIVEKFFTNWVTGEAWSWC